VSQGVVFDFGTPGSGFLSSADLMTGQHSDPLRVVRFNPVTDRAEDVSHAIAQEILRRLADLLCTRAVPSPARPG
jgi:hypothetical protein